MPSPRVHSSWFSVFWLTSVAVVSFLVGGYFAVSLASANLAHWGLWFREFAQSPGAVAVAALTAAIIAFKGISKQVSVSQAVLSHQRRTATDDSWWGMFEWASDRAIPRAVDDRPLPTDVAITTLTQLAGKATSSVQEAACRGVIDALTGEVAKSASEGTAAHASGNLLGNVTSDIEALAAYVDANVGTAAASPIAEALVYERHVLQALASLQTKDVTIFRNPPTARDRGADAVAEVDGKRIAIIIKKPSRAANLRFITGDIQALRGSNMADAFLVIAPFASPLSSEQEHVLNAVVAQWRDESDTASLIQQLRRASALAPASNSPKGGHVPNAIQDQREEESRPPS